MANDLSVLMPKILARSLVTLRESCVMPGLVNSDYSTEAKEKGDTIDVTLHAPQTASDVTPSNTPPAPADTVPTKVQVPLNNWKKTNFKLTDKDMAEIDKSKDFLPGQTQEAVKALANAINIDIMDEYKIFYGFTGTAGTTPFASTAADAINARKKLHQQLCPREGRSGVLDYDAEANALALAAFADASQTGENGVKIKGQIGEKYGINWLTDDHVPTHTAGTGSGYLVNKSGGHAVGDTLITVDTGSGTMIVGDILTFAGHSQTYVVKTALAANVVEIYPPLKAAVADNAAITLKATHVSNLVFHRNAIAFATRVLNSDGLNLGTQQLVMQDPVSKLVMRLEVSRQYKQTMWEFDILWGARGVRPEFGCRIAG